MIAGGGDSYAQDDANVADLCVEEGATCRTIADLPEVNYYGVSLRTSEGNPLLCGGKNTMGRCLEYLPQNNSWVEGPLLLGLRSQSAYVELPGGRFWILSGASSTDRNT